jgi:protein phosphatase PTC7
MRTIIFTSISSLVLGIFHSDAFVQPNAFLVSRRSSSFLHRLYAGLDPLAVEGDWTAYLDEENTGLIYYFNGKTGESLWEKPTPSFPDVVLDSQLNRKALEKQEAYLKSAQGTKSSSKKGFFETLVDSSVDPNSGSETKVKKEDSDWFSPIFEQSIATKTEDKPKQEEKKAESPDWLGSIFDATTEKSKEKESGFFESIFGSSTKEVKEGETAAKIEVKESGKPIDVGGFFGSMFKAASTPEALVDSPTTKEPLAPTIDTKAPVKVESVAFVLPHPAKIFWGGEDAVFVKGRTFGVFDGVSGATKLDGVPLYSKTLANEMKKLIPNDETALSTPDLTRILSQCAETANQISTGASTAIVASIGNDGFLRVVNVGDSTCIVIRDRRVVAKSRERIHYFDCPYQLSVDSPDRPRDGTKLNVELMRGDVVFMASDGVFDNLSEDAIAEVIWKEKRLSAQAKRVSELSRKVSQDRNAITTYAKQAQKYGDPDYASGLGGKLDDVSCIVVRYG